MIEYFLSFLSLYFLVYLLLTYLEEDWEEPAADATPKVSILIPAYNEEQTIAGTIKSALELDYPDYEIMVIDDGSTDSTAKKAEETGVKVLRQKNSGKANALNNALNHAKGELIATLDADSYVDKDALRNMVGFFKNPNVMAVTPTMKVVPEKGVLVKMQKAEYTFSNLMVKIFSLLDSMMVTPGPFSVYRASVFRELGGFNGSTQAEDNEMALRIQSAGYIIKSSKKAVVYTKVPKTISALFRQRKRWYVGYLGNVKKYLRLFNPRYGEFGIFVLPATVILLILMLAKTSLDTISAVNSFFYGTGLAGGFIQPFELLSMGALGIGLVLFFLSILEYREKPSVSSLVYLMFFMLLSPIMYAYAFLMKGYEMITGRSAKW